MTKAQLTQTADYLDKAVSIESSNVDEIKKLNPPAADESTVKGFLSLVDKGDSQMRDASSAARDGDQAKFRSQFDGAGKTLSDASTKAKDYGMTECGQQ